MRYFGWLLRFKSALVYSHTVYTSPPPHHNTLIIKYNFAVMKAHHYILLLPLAEGVVWRV